MNLLVLRRLVRSKIVSHVWLLCCIGAENLPRILSSWDDWYGKTFIDVGDKLTSRLMGMKSCYSKRLTVAPVWVFWWTSWRIETIFFSRACTTIRIFSVHGFDRFDRLSTALIVVARRLLVGLGWAARHSKMIQLSAWITCADILHDEGTDHCKSNMTFSLLLTYFRLRD